MRSVQPQCLHVISITVSKSVLCVLNYLFRKDTLKWAKQIKNECIMVKYFSAQKHVVETDE